MRYCWHDCRIRRTAQFRSIYRGGKRFFSPRMMLLICANSLEHARLGITIPKKKVKNASTRNRIKRQLRALFRVELGELPPVDIILHWRSSKPKDDFDTLKNEFKNLCKQLVAYYPKSASH